MPNGINWIGKFNNSLQFSHARDLITAVVRKFVDFVLVHILLIQDNHPAGRATKPLANVPLNVCNKIIETELVRDMTVDNRVLSLVCRGQFRFVYSDEMCPMTFSSENI